MNVQTITTPTGERMVVMAEADYEALLAAAEDAADVAAVDAFRKRLAAGDEEMIPAAVANRILDGESRIRVWREHRGLTSARLADRAGITQAFLSQIETGKREGTIDTLRRISGALSLTIDDLVG